MEQYIVTSVNVTQNGYMANEYELTLKGYGDMDPSIMLGTQYSHFFPIEKVITKCLHCGQYAARKTSCKYCGAPVD